MKSRLKIVFMGTPDFAVPSLDILFKSGYEVVGVVTVPDKPAGRGQLLKYSPVKNYALKQNLKLLQPINLKNPGFIGELERLHPDLIVVVAFRMLPEVVWKMPLHGTLNLHASLLPQYRGAAPINWAIINGEKETGVTTFFINEIIDTGRILFTERLSINEEETAGELHDRLMIVGSNLVLKTINAIQDGNYNPVSQDQFVEQSIELKPAPKIFRQDCKILWNRDVMSVNNFIRGLSPHPAAFSNLVSSEGERWILKIFKARPSERQLIAMNKGDFLPGMILTDRHSYLDVVCIAGLISLLEIQIEGRRRMSTAEFLRGFILDKRWRLN
jgi:methionyl-tRNA formyltransferase